MREPYLQTGFVRLCWQKLFHLMVLLFAVLCRGADRSGGTDRPVPRLPGAASGGAPPVPQLLPYLSEKPGGSASAGAALSAGAGRIRLRMPVLCPKRGRAAAFDRMCRLLSAVVLLDVFLRLLCLWHVCAGKAVTLGGNEEQLCASLSRTCIWLAAGGLAAGSDGMSDAPVYAPRACAAGRVASLLCGGARHHAGFGTPDR